jgi:hypothetical protein
MANSDPELINEVRSFGQYREEEISDPEIKTAISRAKTDLSNQVQLDEEDWYGFSKLEDALFWASMFFSKLITSSLDAKAISSGAISEKELLAKADNDVTEWYRKYQNKRDALTTSDDAVQTSSTRRTGRTTSGGDRVYQRDT